MMSEGALTDADEMLKKWVANTQKAFPGIMSHAEWRSVLQGVADPGHSHGINWVSQSGTPTAPLVPEALMLDYNTGTRMDATQESRTYWHQWYHHLSLQEKYFVDAFCMKHQSDMVKPQYIGLEIVPHPSIPGGLIHQIKTDTGPTITAHSSDIIWGYDVTPNKVDKVVAQKAELVGDQLKWTPIKVDDVDQPKTPETKEQYEERRNKRIADRVASDMLADANKKLKAKEDAPEKHWSDHRPWPGAHGSQYMLRF